MSDATDTEQSETADAADDTPELPGDGLREGIVAALRDDLGDQLIDTHLVPQTDLWIRVAPESWALTAQVLKAHGFDYFCFLSAIDWLPSPYGKGEDDPDAEPSEPDTEIRQGYTGGESRFQLLARVTDIRRHVSLTIKADVPESMTMATWIPWYAGANWHERETHEMFGIGFDGHPDLRNMYLPGEFEGFPLRKDFPLLSRMVKPWPGIVDVEPMPEFEEDEPAAEAADAEPSDDTAAGDEVAAATETTAADAPDAATDESAAATVADTPPVDDATADDASAPEAADAEAAEVGSAAGDADAAPDAVEPDGDPVEGAAAESIITDDTTTPADDESADESASGDTGDDATADGSVDADLGEGTISESTDADAEAPTPGTGIDDPTDDTAAAEAPADDGPDDEEAGS